MVVVESSKIPLPNPCSLSPPPHPHTTSILFEASSLSLALTHSDSSLSLYPSFSPHSNFNSSHPKKTLIPSPSSSSTFLLLQDTNPNSPSTVLFLVSSPHRSKILLRLYRLRRHQPPSFVRVPRVICSPNKDLCFEPNFGVILDAKHGASVKLAGEVNYFALYALSSNKVWVFAVKDDDGCGGEGENDGGVRLMRCAVIECEKMVFSMRVSFGFLILGEENGVRVFGLRRLVKGRGGVKRVGNLKRMGNGGGGGNVRGAGLGMVNCNGGDLEGKMERHGVAAAKHTNIKFKHGDRDGGSYFVALKGNEVTTKSTTKVSMSIKAISIQAVSRRMFLILDSHGDLHLLHLSNSGIGVDITGNVRQLPQIMKVQSVAVLPDVSTMSQTIWTSDGCHSVHMFSAMDIENALNEADGNDCNEKLMQLPVNRVLFSSERIQDIISLAANSILILGQGSLYAYAIT